MLVPQVPAQATEWSVLRIDRAGDQVSIQLRANADARNVSVALMAGDTFLGLPEQEYAQWSKDETRTATFTLLKDADSATIRFRWTHTTAGNVVRTTDVFLPAAGSTGGGGARIVISDSALDGSTLRLELANVGEAASTKFVVSLEDASQRKIGEPYFRSIDGIAPGAHATATFSVAEGLQEAVVAVEHAGQTERTRLALRGSSSGSPTHGPTDISLTTDLPFREIDIGRSADFAVTVRNAGSLALVQLEVEGLPPGYSARFFVGGSAVPSIYLDNNQTRQATLSVTVPNSQEEVDRTIDFATVARVNGTELASLSMGLAVRGIGKLAVASDEILAPMGPSGETRAGVTVTNTGTAPLFDVQLDARRPYGWTIRTEPARIERLDPGESATVSVQVRAPDVIAAGRYSADVSARSGEVASQWVTLDMEVQSEDGGSGGWLWLLFVGMIAGTLGFGAWKKRQG